MQKEAIIYGIRAVKEAINSGENLAKIFIQKGLRGEMILELQHQLKEQNIPVAYVPVEKLNKLTRENHQGVVASISPISFEVYTELIDKVFAAKSDPLFLLLDSVTDVRNFGAIIRTAECCGVDGIIIPDKHSAPVNAETVKASAGAVFKVPIAKVSHLKDAIYYLKANSARLIAATEKTRTLLYSTDLKGPLAIIMGSEGRGISPSVLKMVDEKARIPLQGTIDSLNVSVACGVLLYEAVRQRLT